MASSWGFLNSLANSIFNSGGVHDYAHAAQVFRTSGFARAPKYKYLYYVNFVIGTDVGSSIDSREIGVLVKSIDLPKFTVDVKDLNQYNRHTYIQDRIKYEPVTIKFHDDNNNGMRELWADYYNYYYADGKYALTDYNNDDRYTVGNHKSAWGLDNGSDTPYFSAIEIYSMYGGESNKITLMTPIITSFSHDTHEYADAQGVMEATMQIRYNGVTYEDGFVSGIPAFNESAYYDNNLSPLSGQFAGGNYIDPITGQLQQQNSSFTNRYGYSTAQGSYGFAEQGTQYDPTANQGLSPTEIDSIVSNNSTNDYADTSFPTANTDTPTIATAIPQPPIRPSTLDSTDTPDSTASGSVSLNPYNDGSWQQTLWNQGYSAEQINSATSFVSGLPASSVNGYGGLNNVNSSSALIAQQYIDNPSSFSLVNSSTASLTNTNAVPTSLTFGDPTTPPGAQYNSNTWQSQLSSLGYSDSDIALASSHLSQINVAPGTDLTSLAKSYILYNKTNTTV